MTCLAGVQAPVECGNPFGLRSKIKEFIRGLRNVIHIVREGREVVLDSPHSHFVSTPQNSYQSPYPLILHPPFTSGLRCQYITLFTYFRASFASTGTPQPFRKKALAELLEFRSLGVAAIVQGVPQIFIHPDDDGLLLFHVTRFPLPHFCYFVYLTTC